jgi:hypothetical protein
MERVQSYLSQLLQTRRYGGRTVVRDEKTLIVYDTPTWGDREARALRARHPECEVAVQASDMSLSGFIVIVTRTSEPWAIASESAFLLALVGVFWTAWCLHEYMRQSVAPLNI